MVRRDAAGNNPLMLVKCQISYYFNVAPEEDESI